jgi:hypothetical protein
VIGPRSRRFLFWLGLIWPGLVPILAPHLPFQDWPAHVAVIGMLDRLGDPAAKIAEYYGFRGWIGPNRLFYAVGWLFAQLLPPIEAANLTLALSLAALGPATLVLCRVIGVDDRSALLATPLALGRHLYCGFSANAAALPPLMLAFAAYFALRQRPQVIRAAAVVSALWLTLGMHVFVYLAGAGLLLLLGLLDLVRGPKHSGALAVGAVGASALLFPLFGVSQDGGGSKGALQAVWSALSEAQRSGLFASWWEWIFASYRYRTLDDWLQAIWLVLLIGLGLAAVVAERGAPPSQARHRLLLASAVALVMFVVLPTNIGPPINWWGGNLRLPLISVLLWVPVAGPALPGRRQWVLAAAAALSLLITTLALFDLVRFHYQEMGGFRQVLAEVPDGARISAMHYTPREVHEYPGEPHGYVSNYVLAVKGGLVPQNLFENAGEPFSRKADIKGPPWGYGAGFRWEQHGAGFDGFIVRINDRQPDAPFDGPLASRVRLVKAAGRWRYYVPASTTR